MSMTDDRPNRLLWPPMIYVAAAALGSGLIDPEDEDCGEGDCGQEGVGASVVSGVDASPVLEACEHVLDPVALPVEDAIVVMLDAVAGMGRDAGCDALLGQGLPEGG